MKLTYRFAYWLLRNKPKTTVLLQNLQGDVSKGAIVEIKNVDNPTLEITLKNIDLQNRNNQINKERYKWKI